MKKFMPSLSCFLTEMATIKDNGSNTLKKPEDLIYLQDGEGTFIDDGLNISQIQVKCNVTDFEEMSGFSDFPTKENCGIGKFFMNNGKSRLKLNISCALSGDENYTFRFLVEYFGDICAYNNNGAGVDYGAGIVTMMRTAYDEEGRLKRIGKKMTFAEVLPITFEDGEFVDTNTGKILLNNIIGYVYDNMNNFVNDNNGAVRKKLLDDCIKHSAIVDSSDDEEMQDIRKKHFVDDNEDMI